MASSCWSRKNDDGRAVATDRIGWGHHGSREQWACRGEAASKIAAGVSVKPVALRASASWLEDGLVQCNPSGNNIHIHKLDATCARLFPRGKHGIYSLSEQKTFTRILTCDISRRL